MKISFLKEDNKLTRKFKTRIDPFHLLLNLWKQVPEVERKSESKMIRNLFLRWIPNACLAPVN